LGLAKDHAKSLRRIGRLLSELSAEIAILAEHASAPDASTPAVIDGERFLRLPEVIAKVGLGRTAILDCQHRGEFPHSIKLASRAVVWRQSDVVKWMDARTRDRK
jgi:prophage regulatory protein